MFETQREAGEGRYVLPLFLFLCLSFSATAAELKIKITGAKGKGTVRIAVYDSASNYMDEAKAVRKVEVNPGKAGVAVAAVTGLPPADYAVAVFQDDNGDKKLNKNFFGAPTERYGFSNNARGSFSPPGFDAAKFALKDPETEIDIKIK